MLRQTVFVLLLMVTSFATLADDALTLPQGVFRFYNIFTSGTINGYYDDGGEEIKLGATLTATAAAMAPALDPEVDPEVTFLRYDFITEYGLRDNISLQAWVPIYLGMTNAINANDDMDTVNAAAAGAFDDYLADGANAGTLGDVLVGVKWQFWKSGKSPLSQDAGDMRAAVAFGGYLPTGTVAELGTTDVATTTVSQYKAFIPGVRTYFDWQLTNWMFINFFSEHQFRLAGDAILLGGATEYEGTFTPGMKNHIELDFSFHPALAENLSLDAGFKTILATTEKGEFSEFDVDALNTKTLFQREYKVEPYAGVFYRGWKIPVKGLISHNLQVAGKNVNKMATTSARIEAYLKF